MEQVPLKSLAPGMILGRDVENKDGDRILAKGTSLTETKIVLLEQWRISEVFVEPRKPEVIPQVQQAKPAVDTELLKAKERLQARFEGRLTNAWMKTLYDEAEKRLKSQRLWDPGQ